MRAPYWPSSGCHSGNKKEIYLVKEVQTRKNWKEAEVQHQTSESLPSLRKAPGVYAQVQYVSPLLQGLGFEGSAAWRDQIELVSGRG